MIDVNVKLTITDGQRRFDLSAQFAADVPFAALYGPSGSGKTLTMQVIAGLLHPREGHVRIDGRTLFDSAAGIDLPPQQRRVGYLFQHYALFPHLTIRQNIAFGLTSWRRRRLSTPDEARIRQLLATFDLGAMADSKPASLSGGQQQRVALARALACEPQVLLLDEPFAALNPMLRHSLRDDLARVRREWGIPALMITHDVDDVIELADVAFVYSNGQVEREIDLRTAQSREVLREDLTSGHSVEPTPMKVKLRRMLLGGSGADIQTDTRSIR